MLNDKNLMSELNLRFHESKTINALAKLKSDEEQEHEKLKKHVSYSNLKQNDLNPASNSAPITIETKFKRQLLHTPKYVAAKDVTSELISNLLDFKPPFTPIQIVAIESLKLWSVKSLYCSFCLGLEKSNPLGRFDRFLTCCDCGSSGHPYCLKYSPSLTQYLQEKNVKWQCYECKKCSVCLQTCDSLLLCDKCDRGYHKECCSPPFTKLPKDDFICHVCKVLAV